MLVDNKWVLSDIIQNITETATDTESKFLHANTFAGA